VGKLTIWPEKHKAELVDKPVALTGAEFALLEVLVRNTGQVVSKEYLSDKALSRPLQETGRSIDMHLSNVRQKLGYLSDGRSYIQSVYGKGYVLIGD
jgi:DNA-binding response OmpR family regulator